MVAATKGQRDLCRAAAHWRLSPAGHDRRNGHLNQAAYSLFLFIRDLADHDLIGWINASWRPPTVPLARTGCLQWRRPDRAAAGGIGCLGQGPRHGPVQPAARRSEEHGLWIEVGGSMIAIDTLVHDFLHPTGVSRSVQGEAPVRVGLLSTRPLLGYHSIVAEHIDARQFNPAFPQLFPGSSSTRFGSSSAGRPDVCTGDRINVARRCSNMDCRVRLMRSRGLAKSW